MRSLDIALALYTQITTAPKVHATLEAFVGHGKVGTVADATSGDRGRIELVKGTVNALWDMGSTIAEDCDNRLLQIPIQKEFGKDPGDAVTPEAIALGKNLRKHKKTANGRRKKKA